MRRLVGLLLVLALVLTPVLGAAQPSSFTILGPGGTLMYSDASITAVNTSNEVSLYQYLVPAAFVATATSVGAVASQYYTGSTSTGVTTPVLFNTPAPLHLRMLGLLAGAAGTSVNLGVNFGAATVTLNNTIIGTIAGPGTPARLDVYLIPIASSSATPTSSNMQTALTAVFRYQNSTGTETVVNSTNIATVATASPTVLNVVGRWAAAASGSSLTFFNRMLRVGE